MKTIEIVIATDGTLKIDALGFSGPDCERATRFLEEALGKVAGKQKKPEHYRQVNRLQQVGR